MLTETVNPEFVSHIADTLSYQHQEKLCGARFVNMLRIMCSLDGSSIVYNQSVVMTSAIVQMMESEENPLPQVKISTDGDVQIACPKQRIDGVYSSAETDWVYMSDFKARGTIHDGVFEKYLMEKRLKDCTDHEKILR